MNSFCGYFNTGLCKSCDLITFGYDEQVQKKEELLRKSLEGLGHPPLLQTVRSAPTHFRNKAKVIVTGSSENPVIGLSGIENLDLGRELLNCSLHTPQINEALIKIKRFITLAKLTPYQIEKKTGELKGIILFYSEHSNEFYLRFIMRSKEAITRIQKHLQSLSDFVCVSVNIQPIPHAILEGEEEIFITEENSIHHRYGSVPAKLGPRAFVQTNQNIAEELYKTAASWVLENKSETFLELFCGQGAFSFHAAPHVRSAYGIEINPDAIHVANETAREAGLSHLKFKSADAAAVSQDIEEFNPDTLLVNPPRRGLGEVSQLLLKHQPHFVIYSSCNYETLAKDLMILRSDYEIIKIQIFDMFPHTSHFETLVLLKLMKARHHF